MKRWRSKRQYLKGESGITMTSLFLISLLVVIMVSLTVISQNVVTADIILQKSIALAVKGAAVHYNSETGEIDPAVAKNEFDELLCKNMKLDVNLQPEKHSAFSDRPNYTLYIFNGPGGGMVYNYNNGHLSESELIPDEFPKCFNLSGEIEAELTTPGVIAEVEIPSKKLFERKTKYKRWAGAKVVKQGQQWAVVLISRKNIS